VLYSLDRLDVVRSIPHVVDYKRWTSRMSTVELKAIRDELNRKISGSEIQTSSWMPGSDWRGTVYQPIWERACNKDVDAAAKCFGLILWSVMKDRDDWWSFGRYKLNDVPIRGLTYFRIENPLG